MTNTSAQQKKKLTNERTNQDIHTFNPSCDNRNTYNNGDKKGIPNTFSYERPLYHVKEKKLSKSNR